jgi:hypothetical protein
MIVGDHQAVLSSFVQQFRSQGMSRPSSSQYHANVEPAQESAAQHKQAGQIVAHYQGGFGVD